MTNILLNLKNKPFHILILTTIFFLVLYSANIPVRYSDNGEGSILFTPPEYNSYQGKTLVIGGTVFYISLRFPMSPKYLVSISFLNFNNYKISNIFEKTIPNNQSLRIIEIELYFQEAGILYFNIELQGLNLTENNNGGYYSVSYHLIKEISPVRSFTSLAIISLPYLFFIFLMAFLKRRRSKFLKSINRNSFQKELGHNSIEQVFNDIKNEKTYPNKFYLQYLKYYILVLKYYLNSLDYKIIPIFIAVIIGFIMFLDPSNSPVYFLALQNPSLSLYLNIIFSSFQKKDMFILGTLSIIPLISVYSLELNDKVHEHFLSYPLSREIIISARLILSILVSIILNLILFGFIQVYFVTGVIGGNFDFLSVLWCLFLMLLFNSVLISINVWFSSLFPEQRKSVFLSFIFNFTYYFISALSYQKTTIFPNLLSMIAYFDSGDTIKLFIQVLSLLLLFVVIVVFSVKDYTNRSLIVKNGA